MSKLKNLFTAVLGLVLLSATANASIIDSSKTTPVEDPFTVQYLGNDGDYLLFKVVMQSDDTRHTSLEISDTDEGELYSAPVRTAFKVQTIKIERTADQKLNFKFISGTNVYSKSFSVLAPVALEVKN